MHFSISSVMVAGLTPRHKFPSHLPLLLGNPSSYRHPCQRFLKRVCTPLRPHPLCITPYSVFHHSWLNTCPFYSAETAFSGPTMQLLLTESDHHFGFSIAFAAADTPFLQVPPLLAPGCSASPGGGVLRAPGHMSGSCWR